jgi:6-phosphogluconolactonase
MKNHESHKPNIEVVESKLFAATVADELVAAIEECLDEKDSCSLVLAGGSTPGAIYRNLSRPPRVAQINWKRVKILLGDERFVSVDSAASNFRMIKETLLSNIPLENAPQVLAIPTQMESAEKAALNYEADIRKSFQLKPDEQPIFDIVLLGMGSDGHTASLFPDSPLLSITDKIVGAAEHPQSGEFRISLLPLALTGAAKIYFIVSGNDKAEAVSNVLQARSQINETPAAMFLQVSNKTTWFLDSEAAQLLPIKD